MFVASPVRSHTDIMVQNVPPAWRAMQYVWEWSDERAFFGNEPEYVLDLEPLLGERHAWWEDLAEALTMKEGKMSLS